MLINFTGMSEIKIFSWLRGDAKACPCHAQTHFAKFLAKFIFAQGVTMISER